MALRDLIAKVVFKVDASQLEAFDKRLASAKKSVEQLDNAKTVKLDVDTAALSAAQAKAAQGIKVTADTSPVVELNAALKGAADNLSASAEASGLYAQGVTADLGAAAAAARGLKDANPEGFADALADVERQAQAIQQELIQLAQTDPSNPRVAELQGSLLSLRGAGREAGDQLKKIGNTELDGVSADLSFITRELEGVDGALDPAKVAQYGTAFEAAGAKAQKVKTQIETLKRVDPKNPQLPALEKQLNEVEREAKEAGAALNKLGGSATGASGAAQGFMGKLSGMQTLLGGLGLAFGVSTLVQWTQETLKAADAVGKSAASLGMATDEYQAWSAFASEAGASTEHLAGTVKTLAKNMDTVATTGKGPAADAFRTLGIEVTDSEGKLRNMSDVLLETGGKLGELESDTQRLAIAQVLAGEGALKMLPGFKNGTKAAEEQMATLRELAVVYDDQLIGEIEAANDEMGRMKMQMEGLWAQGVNAVLPMFRGFVRFMTPIGVGMKQLAANTNFFQAALGALGVGGLQMLLTKVGALITRFGGWQRIALALGRVLMRFAVPFLLFEDFITFMQGGDSVIGRFLDKMLGVGTAEAVVKSLHAAWDGLTSALGLAWAAMSGDDDAVEAATTRFLKATEGMEAIADDFALFFRLVWSDISEATSSAVGDMGTAVSDGFTNMLAALFGWGDDVAGWAAGVWQSFLASASSAIDGVLGKLKELVSSLPVIGDDIAAAFPSKVAVDVSAPERVSGSAAPRASQTSSVSTTFTDNSTQTFQLNGVQGGDGVRQALDVGARNLGEQRRRSNRVKLRNVVGATG